MTQKITSTHNPRLKELRKLHDRKQRESTGLFFAEGEDMVKEALRRQVLPRAVFYDSDELAENGRLLAALQGEADCVPVEGATLARLGSLGSGSRVIGVWEQRWATLEAGRDLGVAAYLHEVADPGNVGAVLRSALALVPGLVVLSPGCADPFGPKAVRASMGAIFGQPVARASFEQARSLLSGHRAVALAARAGRPLRDLDLSSKALFCLGAERPGLPAEIVSACDEVAHVPLRTGGAESLNVAMTATICFYEAALHPGTENERPPLGGLT
jgi:TrmH family RNA methyltransferase